MLYHLGGNRPWVEKVIDIIDHGIAPPEGSEVVQVHMVRCVCDDLIQAQKLGADVIGCEGV
jgi:hypothetical protein